MSVGAVLSKNPANAMNGRVYRKIDGVVSRIINRD